MQVRLPPRAGSTREFFSRKERALLSPPITSFLRKRCSLSRLPLPSLPDERSRPRPPTLPRSPSLVPEVRLSLPSRCSPPFALFCRLVGGRRQSMEEKTLRRPSDWRVLGTLLSCAGVGRDTRLLQQMMERREGRTKERLGFSSPPSVPGWLFFPSSDLLPSLSLDIHILYDSRDVPRRSRRRKVAELFDLFASSVDPFAGGIGQPLSLLLKLNKDVTDLRLYDIRGAPGVGADLGHIDTPATVCLLSSFFSCLKR